MCNNMMTGLRAVSAAEVPSFTQDCVTAAESSNVLASGGGGGGGGLYSYDINFFFIIYFES